MALTMMRLVPQAFWSWPRPFRLDRCVHGAASFWLPGVRKN
jgi:hypothetical protein